MVVLVGGLDLDAQLEHELENVLFAILTRNLNKIVVEFLSPETAGHKLILNGKLSGHSPEHLRLLPIVTFIIVCKLIHLLIVEAFLQLIIGVAIIGYN